MKWRDNKAVLDKITRQMIICEIINIMYIAQIKVDLL